MHSLLAKGRLLYTHDETIADLCARLHAHRRARHRSCSCCAPRPTRCPRSTRRTSGWSRAAISSTPRSGSSMRRRRSRAIEVVAAAQLADREVIPQALALNPAFFTTIYTDLLNAQKTRESVQAALDAVDGYRRRARRRLFAPVLEHLREAGEARSATRDRRALQAPLRHRAACHDGLRIPGRPGPDRQGVDARAPDAARARSTCRSWRSSIDDRDGADEGAHGASRSGDRTAAERRATTIAVQGARVHNLKNISLEIPRDSLIVVTGLSGSGKSSLAFDTIYAEGQRRYMESLSSYAKRFVAQVAKPDVDFVFGLSPVISIEQKTIANNPRSTVGTMTDIASYLNLLFATIGEPHCPRTGEPAPSRTREPDPRSDPLAAGRRRDRAARAGVQGLRRGSGLRLHRGAQERLPPADRRRQAARHLRLGRARSGEDGQSDDEMVPLDRQHRRHRRSLHRRPEAREGDQGRHRQRRCSSATGCCRSTSPRGRAKSRRRALLPGPLQPDASLRLRRHRARVLRVQQPRERLPDVRRPRRRQGHPPGTARARSAAQHPGRLLRARGLQIQPRHLGRPDDVQPGGRRSTSRSIPRGTSCRRRCATPCSTASSRSKIPMLHAAGREGPARATGKGKEVGFNGIARRIERYYRRYRQRGEANSRMEAWLDKVMVEQTCPDCKGARRPRHAAAVHRRRPDASTTSGR